MRRARAALTTLLIIISALLATGPAVAGGPTSVLLVAPDTGRSASLYVTERDYQTLADLLGVNEPVSPPARLNEPGVDESGPAVTVTWLIHDVHVWRVDRVYVAARGGPLISTRTSSGSGDIMASAGTWRVAERGKELVALLERLGVSPRPGAANGGAAVIRDTGRGGVAGATASAQPAPAAAERDATGASDARTPGTGETAWGVIGLALGAAASVIAMRLLARRTRTDAVGRVTEAPRPGDSPAAVELASGRQEQPTPWREELSSSPWTGR